MSRYPLGASVAVAELQDDPHPLLAALREREPVSWIPALEGWLVTSYGLALAAMRDASTFTVQDPRFSTAQVIGPSMLSLDGVAHARHRAPFVAPFRPRAVRERFTDVVAAEAEGLAGALRSRERGELRQAFAAPLAATIVTRAVGLDRGAVPEVLACYGEIVGAVTQITTAGADTPPGAGTMAGRRAFDRLAKRLRGVLQAPGGDSLLAEAAAGSELTEGQIVADAAVLLFGGIETTEGMIANALVHVLERPATLARVRERPDLLDAAIEESLRLEPAAAVIDRYATRDAVLGPARIAAGELVHISIAGANRDPEVFPDPDRLDLQRRTARAHLAFAQGPHVCVGVHLARLEARAGIAVLLERLPGLALDPDRPSRITGLVFRKPAEVHVTFPMP
ncbi:MAG: cytochrome P450 [Actinomycetota bacterium]|nr:cytochrome P450 [Actinomycetota bacterium]